MVWSLGCRIFAGVLCRAEGAPRGSAAIQGLDNWNGVLGTLVSLLFVGVGYVAVVVVRS